MTKTPGVESLAEATFRAVIGNFTSGVTVITARQDGVDYGLTASAVASVSLEPPMVACCLNDACGTTHAIKSSQVFAVNILHEAQGDLARQFATAGDKFRGLDVHYGQLGEPLLPEALARLECEVASDTPGGETHSVFLARVVSASATEGQPLTYFRGNFGHFRTESHEAVQADVRERVLDRRLALGERIEPGALAEQLDVERTWVVEALFQLAAEGLVERDRAQDGWRVVPVDVAVSDSANAARCAIEVGVADLVVGRVSKRELDRLRAAMKRTEPLVRDGRFVDVAAYNDANNDFHECIVGFADCKPLLLAYRRLGMPGIMARTLSLSNVADDELIADHRQIVSAFEREDREAARIALEQHTDRAASILRRALEASGGVI